MSDRSLNKQGPGLRRTNKGREVALSRYNPYQLTGCGKTEFEYSALTGGECITGDQTRSPEALCGLNCLAATILTQVSSRTQPNIVLNMSFSGRLGKLASNIKYARKY